MLEVRGPAQLAVPSLPGNRAHTLEVVTASLVYCVLAGSGSAAWERAVRQALMPMASGGGGGDESAGELTANSCIDLLSDCRKEYPDYIRTESGNLQTGIFFKCEKLIKIIVSV